MTTEHYIPEDEFEIRPTPKITSKIPMIAEKEKDFSALSDEEKFGHLFPPGTSPYRKSPPPSIPMLERAEGDSVWPSSPLKPPQSPPYLGDLGAFSGEPPLIGISPIPDQVSKAELMLGDPYQIERLEIIMKQMEGLLSSDYPEYLEREIAGLEPKGTFGERVGRVLGGIFEIPFAMAGMLPISKDETPGGWTIEGVKIGTQFLEALFGPRSKESAEIMRNFLLGKYGFDARKTLDELGAINDHRAFTEQFLGDILFGAGGVLLKSPRTALNIGTRLTKSFDIPQPLVVRPQIKGHDELITGFTNKFKDINNIFLDEVGELSKKRIKAVIEERKDRAREWDSLLQKEVDDGVDIITATRRAYTKLGGKFATADSVIPSEFRIRISNDEMIDLLETVRLLEPNEYLYNYNMIYNVFGLGKIPIPSEMKRLRRLFGSELGDQLEKLATIEKTTKLPGSESIFKAVIDLGNTPRAMMSSFDFSFGLLQAKTLGNAHPKEWIAMWKPALKAWESPEGAQNQMEILMADKDFSLIEELVDITDWTVGGRLTSKEESFASNFAQVFPWVRWSSRAHAIGLNKLRFDVMKKKINLYSTQSISMKDPRVMNELVEYGKWVNYATGRGKLHPKFKNLELIFNSNLLFSPKKTLGDIQGTATMFNPMTTKDARLAAVGSHGASILTSASFVALLAMAGKSGIFPHKWTPRVSNLTSPSESDWMDISFGPIHLKTYGAIKQQVTAFVRLFYSVDARTRKASGGRWIFGEYDKEKHGPIRRQSGTVDEMHRWAELEILGEFFANKTQPVISTFRSIVEGEDFVGDTPSRPGSFWTFPYGGILQNLSFPLSIQSILDVGYNSSYSQAILGLPEAIGINSPTYWKKFALLNFLSDREHGKSWNELTTQAQKTKVMAQPEYTFWQDESEKYKKDTKEQEPRFEEKMLTWVKAKNSLIDEYLPKIVKTNKETARKQIRDFKLKWSTAFKTSFLIGVDDSLKPRDKQGALTYWRDQYWGIQLEEKIINGMVFPQYDKFDDMREAVLKAAEKDKDSPIAREEITSRNPERFGNPYILKRVEEYEKATETLREYWNAEKVTFDNIANNSHELRLFPKLYQYYIHNDRPTTREERARFAQMLLTQKEFKDMSLNDFHKLVGAAKNIAGAYPQNSFYSFLNSIKDKKQAIRCKNEDIDNYLVDYYGYKRMDPKKCASDRLMPHIKSLN